MSRPCSKHDWHSPQTVRHINVEEYCSEGWVKVPAGKTLDRKGQPLLINSRAKD
jgi:hypothetical protein